MPGVPRFLSRPSEECAAKKSGGNPALQERFERLVMCDFTPRKPSALPMAEWASYKQLRRLFEPHANKLQEVRQLGPGNLKKLITEWYASHPAFAGLELNAWCKKLTDYDPQATPRSQVYKFCFEYTPGGQQLSGGNATRKRGRQWPTVERGSLG